MDNDDEVFLKQRKTQISKSFESLISDKNEEANLDLQQFILDHDDNKNRQKLIDKDQQTTLNSSLTLENACWFVLSLISVYVSDIFNVLMFDQRINR